MNEELKCQNCKYYMDLSLFSKEISVLPKNSSIISGFTIETNRNQYQKSHCCIAFIDMVEKTIYETDPDDKCEMFKAKE